MIYHTIMHQCWLTELVKLRSSRSRLTLTATRLQPKRSTNHHQAQSQNRAYLKYSQVLAKVTPLRGAV